MQLFERITHPDELLNRIQDRLKAIVNAIARKPVIDGVLMEALVGDTETRIEHKLGRVPHGWIILNGNGYPGVGWVYETQAPDEKFLYLSNSLGDGTIPPNRKFWVF